MHCLCSSGLQEKQTPYDLAVENGHAQVAALIADHMNKANGSKNTKSKPQNEKQKKGVSNYVWPMD